LKEDTMTGGSSGAAIVASQLQDELNQDQSGQAGGNDFDVDVPNEFHHGFDLDLGDPIRTAVRSQAPASFRGDDRNSGDRHKTP